MRFLMALVSACVLSACATAPAPEAQTVRLYAMDCGRLQIGDTDMFADDGSYAGVSRGLVDPCYLIRHPDGDLIWDTGLPEEFVANPPPPQGPFQLIMERTPSAQLGDLGLAPADIEYLSVSHSHFDHMGNAALFARATWIVDPDEYAHAFRPEARADAENFGTYAVLENARRRDVIGDTDVFGDGTAVILETPGHTPGHTILQLRLANAGVVLLTGDMFHMAESRANRRVPRFNTNREQTLASMERIEAIAAATGARVVRQHVPEDFAALPAFPAYLD